MYIKKYASGPQIEGLLFVCKDEQREQANKWLVSHGYRGFTLMSESQFKTKLESWRGYSQWWASLWSTIEIDGEKYTETYPEA